MVASKVGDSVKTGKSQDKLMVALKSQAKIIDIALHA